MSQVLRLRTTAGCAISELTNKRTTIGLQFRPGFYRNGASLGRGLAEANSVRFQLQRSPTTLEISSEAWPRILRLGEGAITIPDALEKAIERQVFSPRRTKSPRAAT
jgi:hypothetical protein